MGITAENFQNDPILFQKMFWPDILLTRHQREIMYSLRDNDETYVPAGNDLGKDFISAFAVLWFFCSRRPARVVTTSVKWDQLNDVLWGEIRRFLDTTDRKLPIRYNEMHIRQVRDDGLAVPLSEVRGQCISKGESLLGRHLPHDIARTLCIFDEASGIEDSVYESSTTWAHKILVIGNCYPCSNFFFRGITGGDLKSPTHEHYFRKVIRITAEESPNVRLAKAEIAAGKKPSGRCLVPGILDYNTYVNRRQFWDPIRQCIGLDGEFYVGPGVLLFPPEWLNLAEQQALELRGKHRKGVTMGIDTAEGGDSTVWCVLDELGIVDIVSKKTPDTSVIMGETLALMLLWSVDPDNVFFDRGGGGKEHADYMRRAGHKVNTVAFGEAATAQKQRGMKTLNKRLDDDEVRYTYKNRRAEMYNLTSLRLNPEEPGQLAIPQKYTELRRQLAPVPRLYDGEGRLELPPKRKQRGSDKETMADLVGCSPDEADALVLAVYGLVKKHSRPVAGGAW